MQAFLLGCPAEPDDGAGGEPAAGSESAGDSVGDRPDPTDSGEPTATDTDPGDSDHTGATDTGDSGADSDRPDTADSAPCLPAETGGDTGPPVLDTAGIAEDAAAVLYGAPGTELGRGLAALPDLDGDGVAELAVGDLDGAWVHAGGWTGTVPVRTGAWRWASRAPEGSTLGLLAWSEAELLLARAGQDTYDDVVQRARIDGPCGGEPELLYSSSWDDYHGSWPTLAGAGDTDGDGEPDLVIAAFWYGIFESGGEVRIHPGPLAGREPADASGVTLFADNYGEAGAAVGVGDTDGDGLDDVFVSWVQGDGKVWGGLLYRGPFPSDREPEDADRQLESEPSSAYLSTTAPGDLDGDGLADLALGSPSDDPGRVWLLSGLGDGGWSEADALATLTGGAASGFGTALARLDARADEGVVGLLVQAADTVWEPAYGPTSVWVGFGPFAGAVELGESWTAPSAAGSGLGAHMLGDADLTGDGVADAAISAPEASLASTDRGVVYLLDGARW